MFDCKKIWGHTLIQRTIKYFVFQGEQLYEFSWNSKTFIPIKIMYIYIDNNIIKYF